MHLDKALSTPNVVSLNLTGESPYSVSPLNDTVDGNASHSPADNEATEGLQPTTPPPSQEHTNWLLRFFQSELFDASLALHYLYRSKSKDTGVQQYLGNLRCHRARPSLQLVFPGIDSFVFRLSRESIVHSGSGRRRVLPATVD